MALYHLTARTGTRAHGASALAKAEYIQREGRYARVPDRVVYTAAGNLPSFAAGRASAYFEAADRYERANGRLFKEVEFALPVELEPDDQRDLALRFAGELLAGEPLPYALAIHEGRGHNPHCHVLVSERVNDGVPREARQWFRRWNARAPDEGGARKTRALKPLAWLERMRERWASLVNQALERAGFLERVDHRSLAAQGISRVPQIHLGPNVVRMEERGLGTNRGDVAQRIEDRNRAIAEHRSAIREIDLATPAQERRSGSSDSTNETSRMGDASTTGLEAPESREAPSEAARTARAEPAAPPDDELADPRTDQIPGRAREAAPPEPQTAPATRSGWRAHDPGDPHDIQVRTSEGSPSAKAVSPSPNIGRTARAVSRQLAAMGCERFDIGIREAWTGRLESWTWSREEVLEHLAFLKHRNARGAEIQVRPAAEAPGPRIVLLDGLDRRALRTLERDGRAPAVVVESTPGRFEAWVRVPHRASEASREWIARRLAREVGGDPLAASPQAWGQLAGFTSQRALPRESDGLHSFALLRGASGRAAPEGGALLREAEQALGERRRESERTSEAAKPPQRPHSPEAEREATELFRDTLQELRRRGMDDPDRWDLAAARRLAAAGFEAETIEGAMRAASSGLEQRKGKELSDYVRRTADLALEPRQSSLQHAKDRSDLER